MITLMHSTRSRALTTRDAAILDRMSQNWRAAYAAADRRDAEAMYARTDAVGEKNGPSEPTEVGRCQE
jgi:hypothetical protein